METGGPGFRVWATVALAACAAPDGATTPGAWPDDEALGVASTRSDTGPPNDSPDSFACFTGFGEGGLLIEPQVVGFELDAVVLADQTLSGYETGYGYQPPTLTITFGSAEFLDALDPYEEAATSCFAFGEFLFPVPLAKPTQIPLADPAILYASYDGAVNLEYANCAGRVDAATWGADAEYLLGPFHGAHVGIGLGRVTDALREGWSEETVAALGDAMLAEHVAINDRDGNFLGRAWTTAFAFAYDPDAGGLVTGTDGYLVPVRVDGLAEGADLPEAYLRSFAIGYQDFAALDLANLRVGAPPLP